MHRRGLCKLEPTPIWFSEFTAPGGGGFYGTPGRGRMYAYLGLMMGAQGILAWTFNSHHKPP